MTIIVININKFQSSDNGSEFGAPVCNLAQHVRNMRSRESTEPMPDFEWEDEEIIIIIIVVNTIIINVVITTTAIIIIIIIIVTTIIDVVVVVVIALKSLVLRNNETTGANLNPGRQVISGWKWPAICWMKNKLELQLFALDDGQEWSS